MKRGSWKAKEKSSKKQSLNQANPGAQPAFPLSGIWGSLLSVMGRSQQVSKGLKSIQDPHLLEFAAILNANRTHDISLPPGGRMGLTHITSGSPGK